MPASATRSLVAYMGAQVGRTSRCAAPQRRGVALKRAPIIIGCLNFSPGRARKSMRQRLVHHAASLRARGGSYPRGAAPFHGAAGLALARASA
eukprot:scaffold332_cov105-Isochrysis_galbana.AAC.7